MSEIKNRATLDNTQFQAGLKNMQGQVQNLGRSMRGIPGIGAALSIAGLAKMATDAIRSADEIDNLAQQMDLGVETVQAYQIGLKEAGLSMGDLQGAVSRLQRAQAESIQGNQKNAQSFAALGISMDRLRQMGTEELLESVGRGLSDNQGSAQATQASYDLLGRSAGRLTEVLVQMNRDGIQAQIQAYKELGLVIDENMIARLDAAELRMARFGGRAKSFAARTTSNLMQGLEMVGGMIGGASFDEAFRQSEAPQQEAMNARREAQAARLQAQIDAAESGAGEQLETLREKMRLEQLASDALRTELNLKLQIAQADLEASQSNIEKFAALQRVYDIEQQISRIKDEQVEAEEKAGKTSSSWFREMGGAQGAGSFTKNPERTRQEKQFDDMNRAITRAYLATREQTDLLRQIANQDGSARL